MRHNATEGDYCKRVTAFAAREDGGNEKRIAFRAVFKGRFRVGFGGAMPAARPETATCGLPSGPVNPDRHPTYNSHPALRR